MLDNQVTMPVKIWFCRRIYHHQDTMNLITKYHALYASLRYISGGAT